MILSMTGFGKTTCEIKNKQFFIEIKSLNNKQIDVFIRIPGQFREKEIELRNILLQRLERGKIEVIIFVENTGKEGATQLNIPIIKNYYEQIVSASQQLQIALPDNWFSTLLRLPDAMKTELQEVDEEEWNSLLAAFSETIDQLIAFRTQEGAALQNVFETKIDNIRTLLAQIEPYEKERIEKVKTRILENLSNLNESTNFDKNRFEQELIYYIEKLDISEEKNRLAHHLTYFCETMHENASGKKLGFIAQEIGREINTLGSKANHLEMQKIVVKMKDELEQIKEQVLNVL